MFDELKQICDIVDGFGGVVSFDERDVEVREIRIVLPFPVDTVDASRVLVDGWVS